MVIGLAYTPYYTVFNFPLLYLRSPFRPCHLIYSLSITFHISTLVTLVQLDPLPSHSIFNQYPYVGGFCATLQVLRHRFHLPLLTFIGFIASTIYLYVAYQRRLRPAELRLTHKDPRTLHRERSGSPNIDIFGPALRPRFVDQ